MSSQTADDGEINSLGDILARVHDADQDGRININEVLAAFEDRSTGVLVTMLGLLAALPIVGAIPGMSMATGSLILLAIARDVFGGGSLRLPGRLGRLSVKQSSFDKAVDTSSGLTRRVDGLLRRRLTGLSEGRLARAAILLAVALLAVTMFPLAFVPWGVTAPSFGIVAFGLALIARDGAFALAGYAMIVATILTAILVV